MGRAFAVAFGVAIAVAVAFAFAFAFALSFAFAIKLAVILAFADAFAVVFIRTLNPCSPVQSPHRKMPCSLTLHMFPPSLKIAAAEDIKDVTDESDCVSEENEG